MEYRENLLAKEALTDEAEKTLPIENLGAAKTALRSIQDHWDRVGRVSFSNPRRIEGRLRAVEMAIHDAEKSEWCYLNPETRVCAQGMPSRLESQLVSLGTELKAVEERGDEKRAESLSEAIEMKRT